MKPPSPFIVGPTGWNILGIVLMTIYTVLIMRIARMEQTNALLEIIAAMLLTVGILLLMDHA